ncbi:MAG: hypothetical protein ABW123_21670 [Cystobacter sp.]
MSSSVSLQGRVPTPSTQNRGGSFAPARTGPGEAQRGWDAYPAPGTVTSRPAQAVPVYLFKKPAEAPALDGLEGRARSGGAHEPRGPRLDSVQQQQKAYGARAGSLGFGTQAESLQRAFPIPEATSALINQVVAGDKGLALIQPIAQRHIPSQQEVRREGGLSNGMTKEWMALHADKTPEGASKQFGATLNTKLERIVSLQASDGQGKAHVSPVERERLERTMYEEGVEGITLNAASSGAITGAAEAVAKQLQQKMNQDGLYRVFLHDPETGGNAILSAFVSKDDGTFKLMDPNVAEFSAKDASGFQRLLERNISLSGYHNKYSQFVVHHYNVD